MKKNLNIKKMVAMVLVVTSTFGLCACQEKHKQIQLSVVGMAEVYEEAHDEVEQIKKTILEERSKQKTQETQMENVQETTPVETKKTTSSKKPSTQVATKTPQKETNKGTTAQTPPSVPSQPAKACEHDYELEHREYELIEHYIYGCNGCGYPLFTIQGGDAINLPNLYSHPACYSEKLGMDCVGGGFHSEVYYRGFCYICHDEIQLRSCMFSEMGKRCVKNEALGPYTKIELGRYPAAYLKSCSCGANTLCVGGEKGSGLMLVKKTCKLCGVVETFPQK